MADIWPALTAQLAVCIDDCQGEICLRQEDKNGNESTIYVAKENIDRLIEQLQLIER